jgi:hypothetical protein
MNTAYGRKIAGSRSRLLPPIKVHLTVIASIAALPARQQLRSALTHYFPLNKKNTLLLSKTNLNDKSDQRRKNMVQKTTVQK